jgi:hypothetical protein
LGAIRLRIAIGCPDDVAMERLDDMRASLETDAIDPPGLAPVRGPGGTVEPADRLRLPVQVLFRRCQPAGRRRTVNNA